MDSSSVQLRIQLIPSRRQPVFELAPSDFLIRITTTNQLKKKLALEPGDAIYDRHIQMARLDPSPTAQDVIIHNYVVNNRFLLPEDREKIAVMISFNEPWNNVSLLYFWFWYYIQVINFNQVYKNLPADPKDTVKLHVAELMIDLAKKLSEKQCEPTTCVLKKFAAKSFDVLYDKQNIPTKYRPFLRRLEDVRNFLFNLVFEWLLTEYI